MRIISGKFRGRKLIYPDSERARPTRDQVRETMFNILNSYMVSKDLAWEDQTILDAFAGSGSLGCEALSRGAKKAIFFEKEKDIFQICRDNILRIDPAMPAAFWSGNVLHPPKAQDTITGIFLDPPYNMKLVPKALAALDKKGWIHKPWIIVECDEREKIILPPAINIVTERAIGATRVILGEYA